jgi:4,5-dihydroxyphthalate decarboxylase
MTPAAVVAASFTSAELDLAEVSTGGLAQRVDRGIGGYVGIPAFVSMAMRHDCLYVAASGAKRLGRDLAGGRIGINDVAGTSGIWLRGMLQDQFGVDPRGVDWVLGPTDAPAGAAEPPKFGGAMRVSVAPEGHSLVDLLRGGRLDAIVSLRIPRSFAQAEGVLRRLFDDLPAVEAEYVNAMGAPPALHLMALKQSRVAEDATLPAQLLEAFTAAKDIALAELRDTACYHASLPFLVQAVERAQALLGADFHPYGLDRHRKGIDAFCRYCHEQGLTTRRLGVADLFPHFA